MDNRNIFRAVQAGLCILIVALLSMGAMDIYREGAARKAEHPLEPIYSPEAVAEKSAPILPLVFFALGLTAAGLLLNAGENEKPAEDAEISRNLLSAQVAQPSEAMKREVRRRRLLSFFGWLGFAACMVPILVYMLDGKNFPDGNLEPMIASLAAVLIPWTVAGLSCLTVSAFLREKSLRREAEAAKEQRKAEKDAGITPLSKKEKRAYCLGPWQTAFCVAAIALIVIGIFNGSALDVLIKAINICSECIGLG